MRNAVPTPPLIPIAELELLAQGVDHPEGICRTIDDVVYFGGESGQLYRLEADGTYVELLTTGGFLLGLAADAEGRIYACDPGKNCVWRLDPRTTSKEVFCDTATGRERLLNPNWGCFDRNGNYYFSDSGGWKNANGVVIVVRPGRGASVWTDAARDFPNGCAISPDGGHLLVLESTPGALVRFEIRPDGSAGPREVLVELPGAVPDGVALATDGSLVIACYRPDVVYRWREDLGLQVLIADEEGTAVSAPTNVVFCGSGLGTMIVPNLGRWHLTRFNHPSLAGVPVNYPTREQIGS
jgi:gluconolactonase